MSATVEKKVYEKFTTPKGKAEYPHLIVPVKFDNIENKSKPDPDGDYNVTLILPSALLEPNFISKIDKLAEDAFKETVAKAKAEQKDKIEKTLPYSYETGTGNIKLKFKAKARSKNKDGVMQDNKIIFYDAKKNKIEPKDIWSGSVLRVNATIFDFVSPGLKKGGVSLFINAVQIIELVSGANDATAFGFDEEEGYSSSTETDVVISEEVNYED